VVLKKFTWPAELTLTLIGGKWKGLILHRLLTGESKRFGELKRLAPGISAKILAKHLKELEFDGLITRMVTGTDKPRILYAPTERSRSLAPVLAAIQQWGEENLESYDQPAKPADRPQPEQAAKTEPAPVVAAPAALPQPTVDFRPVATAPKMPVSSFTVTRPGYGSRVPESALIS
jgi:DNA-binding HxlR family transcriptional regulator